MKIIPLTMDDEALAEDLSANLPVTSDTDVVLMASQTGCFLRRITPPVIDWRIDFLSAEYQQAFAGRGKQDPLSRALGLHKDPSLHVLDMTAGLGKDALWIAHCGATVTMLERHPVLAYLLQEAVNHGPYRQTMQVNCTSAQDYLSKHADFDVAYYDPMFEVRQKSALVKKDMQILQALHGEETADPTLITRVKDLGKKIVVKRAKADLPLVPNPHHSIETKVTRFDVY